MVPSHLMAASRFLSWALRHNPADAGLTLDTAGWATVKDVLYSLHQRRLSVTLADLRTIVAGDEKQRFSLSEGLIRANYAHSIDIAIPPASPPPDRLFHGTARVNLDEIKPLGLLRQRRQFVHLTTDIDTAFSIGRRYGPPVVIPVKAAAMQMDGYDFHHGAGTIWMTRMVPPQYLLYNELLFDPSSR